MENEIVVNGSSEKKGFWQRHPVLKTLLTIFLCLLLVGIIMLTVYHIMHAINSSKKNDKIDDVKKADKNIKNNKDKLSEESQKKLKKGELTKEDVDKEITRQGHDKNLAEEEKNYIDEYSQETDATKKSEISNQYANSQEEALTSGRLNSTSLKETLKNEQSELDAAKAGVDEAAKLAENAGIATDKIGDVKANSEATIDTTSYSDAQKTALETLRETVRKQGLEQADVDYVTNKLADVQAYENATTEVAKTTALNTFKTNETTRFTTDLAISTEDAGKWVSREKSELQGAQDFAKSFDTISDISKDNGFTYKAGTTTTDEMTKAIENNYSSKFPKSDGAFRIIGDAAAAAGVLGAIGTGIYAACQNSQDEDSEEVEDVANEKEVINDNAKNNVKKCYSKTTTTTVSK